MYWPRRVGVRDIDTEIGGTSIFSDTEGKFIDMSTTIYASDIYDFDRCLDLSIFKQL